LGLEKKNNSGTTNYFQSSQVQVRHYVLHCQRLGESMQVKNLLELLTRSNMPVSQISHYLLLTVIGIQMQMLMLKMSQGPQ
jgi:hypothetical protein